MKRRTLLSRLGGTAAVTAIAGCSIITGGGETTTGDAGDQEELTFTTTEEPAETDTSTEGTGTTDEDGSTATATEEGTPDVQFKADVEEVAKCSKTCRTLTYAVQNRGGDAAPDVTVRIRVFTDGEKIWDKNQDVGSIDARSQRTGISRDIDVGVLGGQKIKNNDGKVVIKLTPQSSGVSETFTFERTLDV